MARDENRYLAEWVRYHLDLGFDHILLFDNHSKVPLQSEIDKLPSAYADRIRVELEPPSENPQYRSYQRAYQLGSDAEWIAYIDLDEFLVIDRPLRELLDRPDNVGAIFIFWQFYNANGQEKYEDRPVIERFTQVCRPSEWCYGKSIARPKATLSPGAHYPALHARFYMVTDDGRRIYKAPGPAAVQKPVRVNHYYTKSYEEWLWKIERGSSDNRCLKKYMEFFWYNPDLIHLYDPALARQQQNTMHRAPTLGAHVPMKDMSRKPDAHPRLHLGCAENVLPGWINSDIHPISDGSMRLDFTQPLPYPDDAFDAVFCEHAIEHVPKGAAAVMLGEAKRVLRPGGRIRLVTPALEKLCRLVLEPQSDDAVTYLDFIRGKFKAPDLTLADAVNMIFYEHGHRHIYTKAELCGMLEAAGFRECQAMPPETYGASVFDGVDGHGKRVGHNIAVIEAMAVEAVA